MSWGLWHLPAVVLLPLLVSTANVLQALVSIVGLTIGVVGYTIVLTWIIAAWLLKNYDVGTLTRRVPPVPRRRAKPAA